jgi:NAD+ kinase
MKIKIITNPKKEWTSPLAEEVSKMLADNLHHVVDSGADATVCIGGDGTILYAHHQRELEGTVLGIGTLKSYICQLTRDDWKDKLFDILQSESFTVMTLKAEVDGKELIALNDFVVHAKDYRVLDMEISLSGEPSRFRGDGIIISSSMGSPAYAYSAGGEQLRPDERKIVVVPIAPYRRAFSPKTLSESAEITITTNKDFAFITDGIFISDVEGASKVNIQKGDDIQFFHGVGFHEQG